MRVMLCAEGPQDAGYKSRWDSKAREFVSTEGWLQPIVRKYCGMASFEVRYRRDLTLLQRSKTKKLRGHGEKARLARLAAEADECDLLVFMVDADSNDERDWRTVTEDVLEGFAAHPDGPKAVACVPMATSESWLLADAEAWAGAGLKDTKILPRKPEEIWGGRDDPAGGHPHRYFARVCVNADVSDSACTRNALMEATSIEVLLSKCPNSFSFFHSQILP